MEGLGPKNMGYNNPYGSKDPLLCYGKGTIWVAICIFLGGTDRILWGNNDPSYTGFTMCVFCWGVGFE